MLLRVTAEGGGPKMPVEVLNKRRPRIWLSRELVLREGKLRMIDLKERSIKKTR